MSSCSDEAAAVRQRYERRPADDARYGMLDRAALLMYHERQRAIATLFTQLGWTDLGRLRLVEVGCGSGANLLEFLRFGFAPENIQGIELLPARAQQAVRVLPPPVRVTVGDVARHPDLVARESQDIVYQATVFSSLLDASFQQTVADIMWRWVRRGGGVLWYDFTVNNPANPDVRGVSVQRVRELFPEAELTVRHVTLAPPLARAVVRIHPCLYSAFNLLPITRTHVLAWALKS